MNSILQHTWAVLDKKERNQFSWLIVSGIIISIADILALVALLWIINFYIQPGDTVSLSFLPSWLGARNSVLLIAFFVVLFGIKNIIAFFVARAGYTFTGSVAIRISRNSLAGYQHTSFASFVNTDSSSWIRKIALQPFDFAQQVLAGLQQIITQLFLIMITVVAIVIFNVKIFLLLLVVLLPPVIVVFFLIRKRLAATKKYLRDSNEKSYQYLFDSLKGWVEGNVNQRNDFFLQRFMRHRRQFSTYLFNSLSLQSLPGRVIEIFAVLGLFVLIVIAKWNGDNNSGALITIGAFMAAAYKIIPGIVKVINLSGQIRAYEFSVDDLMQTIHPAKNNEASGPAQIHSVEFKSIQFRYADRDILKDFSFSIHEKDMLGISGDSGIGKTTILNLLLGFLKPLSGEVLINGQPVAGTALKKYWPSVSYVRQQSFFIYDTIARNITLEEEGHDKKRLAYALEVSGVDKLVADFPEGLEKMITENGKNISGGQQQRIAMARALYKNADLLLMDEPLNELDEESSFAMLEHLRKLAATGKIIILVTHDRKSLAYCNKTLLVNEQ